jgi:threonine aldolase
MIQKYTVMKVVDLRSDTVTKPSNDLRLAMLNAEVGDDCYGDDPSVLALESYIAELLGKEAALFTSTGTLSNQIAIKAQTRPGDEVITDTLYHISFFEAAQTAQLSGVALHSVTSSSGVLTADDVKSAIRSRARGRMYAQVKLVTVENTISAAGGKIFPLSELRELSLFCRGAGIRLYLDGARLFNASAATGISPAEYANCCDAVSICFAKGLGAPFGAALAGSREFIEEARRFRKLFGGGLHQAGMLAAGAQYALMNNRDLFVRDHTNAALLAELITLKGGASLAVKPETNMVLFDIPLNCPAASEFVARCKERGVLLFAWEDRVVRAVTHQGISRDDVVVAAEVISEVYREFVGFSDSANELALVSPYIIQ